MAKVRLVNHDETMLLREGYPRKVGVNLETEIEMLVSTGVTRVCLKRSVIRALNLQSRGHVRALTTEGAVRTRELYSPVRLGFKGRWGLFDVIEVEENVPNLLGQLALIALDLRVDCRKRQVALNTDEKSEAKGQFIAESFGDELGRGIPQPSSFVKIKNPRPVMKHRVLGFMEECMTERERAAAKKNPQMNEKTG